MRSPLEQATLQGSPMQFDKAIPERIKKARWSQRPTPSPSGGEVGSRLRYVNVICLSDKIKLSLKFIAIFITLTFFMVLR